ncbi:hypothetical protein IWX58_003395 [Rubrivivax gelatinosus]|nr:hypothetical protein [Rubrivivax gelatinosus]
MIGGGEGVGPESGGVSADLIESFDRKSRDECLNEHRFQMLARARQTIAAWRRDYNEQLRLHRKGALCRSTPPGHTGDHASFNQDCFRIAGMAEGGQGTNT